MLWIAKEWKSESGSWNCNCIDKLSTNAGAWYTPARILGWDPADYVQYVIDNFHPDIHYNKEKCLVFFSWKDQSQMRKFKNWINAAARKANYQI